MPIYNSLASFIASRDGNLNTFVTATEELPFDESGTAITRALNYSTILAPSSSGNTFYGTDQSNMIIGDARPNRVIFNKTFADNTLASLSQGDSLSSAALNNLGVAQSNFTLDYEASATVKFKSLSGTSNSLGIYKISDDGTLSNAQILFKNVNQTTINTLHQIDLPLDKQGGRFAFFIISDGANENNNFTGLNYIEEQNAIEFIYNYGQSDQRIAKASDDNNVSLVYNDGLIEQTLSGSVFHTNDRDNTDAVMNPDNTEHVVSGLVTNSSSSALRIGFEETFKLGDADFNDLVFDFDVNLLQFTIYEETGTQNNDIIHGRDGDDYIMGNGGDDTFIASEGNDTFDGGDGTDVIDFRANATKLHVDAHNKTIDDDNDAIIEDTFTDIEHIIGSAHDDYLRSDNLKGMTLSGGGGHDTIQGQAQEDELYGGAGDDLIFGYGSADIIYAEAGADTLIGGTGNDTLHGGNDNDILRGKEDNDALYGDKGSDVLYGDDGNDVLFGGDNKDFLFGGADHDILIGSGNRDALFGQGGADTFMFETTNAFNDLDFIKDFNAGEGDVLNLTNLLIGYSPLDHAINDFVRFTEADGHSYLRIDVDGKTGENSSNYELVARIDNVSGLNPETLEANGNLVGNITPDIV